MQKFLLLIGCCLLTSCSTFHYSPNIYKSRPNNYTKAQYVAPIQVSKDLSVPHNDGTFNIPDGDVAANPKTSMLPPGSLAESMAQKR